MVLIYWLIISVKEKSQFYKSCWNCN